MNSARPVFFIFSSFIFESYHLCLSLLRRHLKVRNKTLQVMLLWENNQRFGPSYSSHYFPIKIAVFYHPYNTFNNSSTLTLFKLIKEQRVIIFHMIVQIGVMI